MSEVDRLRRDRLTETEAAIDDGDDRRVDEAFDRLIGEDIARAHPRDIAGHANDAMAVVAREVGLDQRGGDPTRLVGATADVPENLGAKVDERIGLNMDRHDVSLAASRPKIAIRMRSSRDCVQI